MFLGAGSDLLSGESQHGGRRSELHWTRSCFVFARTCLSAQSSLFALVCWICPYVFFSLFMLSVVLHGVSRSSQYPPVTMVPRASSGYISSWMQCFLCLFQKDTRTSKHISRRNQIHKIIYTQISFPAHLSNTHSLHIHTYTHNLFKYVLFLSHPRYPRYQLEF